MDQELGFAAGDVVRAKSGGPAMTIDEPINDGLRCVWFEKTGELRRETLPPAILQRSEPDPWP